jgi:predicted amidohydrolase YtcJ
MASRFGITAIHDADVGAETLEAYRTLEAQGRLPVRVVASLHAEPKPGESQISKLVNLRDAHRNPRLRADAVKIFVDGVIDSRTAALLEPYAGFPSDRGKPNWEPDALNRMVTALDREKFQVHLHAIGDRAIRMALDALEAARSANGARDARHHIAHLQLIDPADIPRFRRLGVVANFQPLWAQADPYIINLTQPLIGPKRSRWLYPIASVEQTGAMVVFGSDWPVSSMNPLEILPVSITRRDSSAGPGPAWIPEERISLACALAACTIRGAYLSFRDRETGSIESGKLADLVVLDRNLFDVAPWEIHQAKVRFTLVEGQVVFEDSRPRDRTN